ncbi:MAG: NAD(P)/FAD-dependent oxidoreductase [Verrucomicrobiota bacterium]
MTASPPDLSFDLAIVGAGPAGMMAAIAAAQDGARVAVCEQLERPGVKLLASGGGRCNLTNTLKTDDFMARFGRQGRFMQPALTLMDSSALRQFLRKLGVATASPDGFRVYPASNSSAQVQRAIWQRCTALKVTRLLDTRATALVVDEGRIRGVRTDSSAIAAPRVVLATGGRSYPELGATGSGYQLARQSGHTIVGPLPVLVPLITRETWPRECAGASLRGAHVWIESEHSRLGCVGDVLFTHSGLSGPAILDLSRDVAPILKQRGHAAIRMDLSLGTTAGQWLERFDTWQRRHGRRKVVNLLDDHLPASLSRSLASLAGIPDDLTAALLNRAQRQALANLLTGLPLTVVDTGGFKEAMITRGGVNLREVDPNTLQSRLVRGLHFAGEVLDLDGPTGGFNLQWAFSSGWLAGTTCGQPHRAGGFLAVRRQGTAT